MSESKTDMKSLDGILRMGGSGANVVNLVLLVVIGWNARDALATVENTENSVVELRTDNEKLRDEFGDLRADVVENQRIRDEFAKYRAEVDAKMAQLIICVKSKKQCAL